MCKYKFHDNSWDQYWIHSYRKFAPKLRLCCRVCANISYFLMSLSVTLRLANFIASSKWSRRTSGTESRSSSCNNGNTPKLTIHNYYCYTCIQQANLKDLQIHFLQFNKSFRKALTSMSGLAILFFCWRMSASIDSLMASLHARWQISVRSAPLKPCVERARKSRSTSCCHSNTPTFYKWLKTLVNMIDDLLQ